MKYLSIIGWLALAGTGVARAETTVNAVNHCAWGANIGWVNWRGDGANGARIGRYYCSGYLYGANVGWINLGLGNPVNGFAYQNNSAADFGVNTDLVGNLRGYAWSANIGWISFETNGAARVDLRSGALSGYAYSANCGWLSLSNAFAYVGTDTLWPGQTETSGLPIAWEMLNFGTNGVNAAADPDQDGMSNLAEYLAGTDPNNRADSLRITALRTSPTNVILTWSSTLTRCYSIEEADSLNESWTASSLGTIFPDGASTTRTVVESGAATRFYRVKALLPLGP